MTTIISRLFPDEHTAREATAALRAEGFAAGDTLMLTRPADGIPFNTATAMTDLQGFDLPLRNAEFYASAVGAGNALVMVRAPFGTARIAKDVLAEFNAINADVEDVYLSAHASRRTTETDEAAPFSRALGLPALISEPAPFSKLLGLPVLSDRRPHATLAPSRPTFKVRLIDDPAPLSRLLGLPLLFNHPAPFSALLRLPVLIRERRADRRA